MHVAPPTLSPRAFKPGRLVKKTLKRVVPLVLAVVFVPWGLAAYVAFGLLDVCRNSRRNLVTLDRYFAGNGVFTANARELVSVREHDDPVHRLHRPAGLDEL